MQLPGRLRSTTLGDVLGMLHRAHVNGTLELVEDRGRNHRVHMLDGCVVAVEVDGASRSLAEILRADRAADEETLTRSLLRAITSRRLHGEVLVEDFRLAPSVVAAALRRQTQERLAVHDRWRRPCPSRRPRFSTEDGAHAIATVAPNPTMGRTARGGYSVSIRAATSPRSSERTGVWSDRSIRTCIRKSPA